MKKRVPDKFWFPWWPDKWIFGSVRIEFTPAERGIWVDMLSLASKDDGHIRANEETPYPLEQLAGMLRIPEKEFRNAIKKFIKNKKLTKTKTRTLYVTKWDKYQFSDRHKRRVEDEIKKAMSAETAMVSKKKDAIIYNSILNNNKKKNNKEYPPEFESFWKNYPKKKEKKDAYFTWKILTKKQQGEVIIAAKHYKIETDAKKTEESYIKNPKTFLNKKKEKWKDYLGMPEKEEMQTMDDRHEKAMEERK